MDRRLLDCYNRELQHLRGLAGEFAREFPKIAGRLSLDEFECADPYVERLLEGFAFLSARVQLKLDAEFPQFTQSLLETVYPHYLCPIPSMAVVRFQPDMTQSGLSGGYGIPRGETLRSTTAPEDRTACEYLTAQTVTLWPVKLAKAAYYSRELNTLDLPALQPAPRAGFHFRLETGAGQPFSGLNLDSLTFFIRGAEENPMHIYEQLLGHARQVVVQPPGRPAAWRKVLPATAVSRVGFADDEALLPVVPRSFQGYRLLQEYFAFPQRFLFARIDGLREAVKACQGSQLDVVVLLDDEDPKLEGQVDTGNFDLYCTPVINLFPKRTDRIHISDKYAELHVVPDRTRPMDFEIYQVHKVTGYGVRADEQQSFSPFYAATDFDAGGGGGAYFTVSRTPRLLSGREKQRGRRSNYGGSEVYLSLVDAKAAPYRSDLRQLAVETLCTNRDLPMQMGVGRSDTDFTLESNAPVVSVRCLAGPTPPRPSRAEGEMSWRIVSHLSLNYLSIVDSGNGQGAKALTDLLRLYGDANDPRIRKQIEGLVSIASRPIVRRVARAGPVAFARGLEVTLTFEEAAFEGTGVFLLGAVMDVFFSKYVSINSFTETAIRTKERGEIVRWPARMGLRHCL
jgi:type VI secretion system protein ImpG